MSFADDVADVSLTPLGSLLRELAAAAADLAARADAGEVLGPGDGFGLDLQVSRVRRLIGDELLRTQPAFTPESDKAAQIAMASRHHARADLLGASDNRPTEAA